MPTPPSRTPEIINQENIKNFKCVSWISNISGRLFFHLTDDYNYRNDRIVGDVFHYNEKIGNERIFFLSMLIDLRDEASKGKSRYTRIIIFAKTHKDTNSKYLEGNVYFIDDKNYNGLYRSDSEISFLSSIKNIINEDKKKSILNSFKEKIDDFLITSKKESSKSIKTVKFKLNDTGIVFLNNEESTGVDPDTKSAFYLLKFMFHKDRFHEVSAEEIIRVIDIGKSDLSTIANKLVIGVKRYISETRKVHDGNVLKLYNLKGLTGYASTLINVLAKEGFCSSDFAKYEKEQLTQINVSVDKELEARPYRAPTVYQFLSDFQSISIIFLTILGPFLLIYSKAFENIEGFLKTIFLDTYSWGYVLVFSLVFLFDMFYKGTMRLSYLGKAYLNIIGTYNIIKKWSNPNSSKNLFRKFIIPWIINMEMWIRRDRILSLIFVSSVSLLLIVFLYYHNKDLLNNDDKGEFSFSKSNILKLQKNEDNITNSMKTIDIDQLTLEVKKLRKEYQDNTQSSSKKIVATLENIQQENIQNSMLFHDSIKKFFKKYKFKKEYMHTNFEKYLYDINKSISSLNTYNKEERHKQSLIITQKIVSERLFITPEITDFMRKRTCNGQWKQGHTITQVDDLQNFLLSLGLKISDEEKEKECFEQTTHIAVAKFQVLVKLKSDGIVGGKTREAINKHPNRLE